MTSDCINWGIIGTSPISETMVNAIKASTSSKLIAIGSRSSTTAQKFAEKFSIPSCHTSDQLLENPAIDAVYLGLPNHLHKEWMLRCIAAGKHVLCEKPFAISVQEILEVKAALQKKPRVCMEALMYQHHPFTQKICELVSSLGEIKLINAVYTADIAAVANKIESGSIRNLGCYPLSLIRLLLPSQPIEMRAVGRASQDHDHQASLLLKFSNNTIAVISTADDMAMHWQFEVYGVNGMLKVVSNPWLPDCTNSLLIYRNSQSEPEKIIVTAEQPLYTYQINAVNKLIFEKNFKNETLVSFQDSLFNTKLLEYWRQQVLHANEVNYAAQNY